METRTLVTINFDGFVLDSRCFIFQERKKLSKYAIVTGDQDFLNQILIDMQEIFPIFLKFPLSFTAVQQKNILDTVHCILNCYIPALFKRLLETSINLQQLKSVALCLFNISSLFSIMTKGANIFQ